jgi:hypothetical protein
LSGIGSVGGSTGQAPFAVTHRHIGRPGQRRQQDDGFGSAAAVMPIGARGSYLISLKRGGSALSTSFRRLRTPELVSRSPERIRRAIGHSRGRGIRTIPDHRGPVRTVGGGGWFWTPRMVGIAAKSLETFSKGEISRTGDGAHERSRCDRGIRAAAVSRRRSSWASVMGVKQIEGGGGRWSGCYRGQAFPVPVRPD